MDKETKILLWGGFGLVSILWGVVVYAYGSVRYSTGKQVRQNEDLQAITELNNRLDQMFRQA